VVETIAAATAQLSEVSEAALPTTLKVSNEVKCLRMACTSKLQKHCQEFSFYLSKRYIFE